MTIHNKSSREVDLQIAARTARDITENTESTFVLTGSYSIDLLTGSDITHNDVDANIFSDDVSSSLGHIGLMLDGKYADLRPVLRTENRLEYAYIHAGVVSQIELQFVEYFDKVVHEAGIDFILPEDSLGREAIVPVVRKAAKINDETGEIFDFSIKSLPFAIATWALRISGIALNQKRDVRQSDIDHFMHLVDTTHDEQAVRSAIEHHPQMPVGMNADDVFEQAAAILSRSTNND